ncbi:MAG: BamA/TamA family outer membrane protein [Ignavibacteria bacterium]|nr:BamA/TamA family outer membrane protein [Ignavibacteria bacterium]
MKLFCILFLAFSALSYAQEDEQEITAENLTTDEINITFKNTASFDEDEILAIIKTGNSEFFNYDEFALDVVRIEKFYFDHGFFDTEVDTSTVLQKDMEISVNFIIREKKPYRIKEIIYKGLEYLPDDIRRAVFNNESYQIINGDVYNKVKVFGESNRVLKELQNNGYAFSTQSMPVISKIESANPDMQYKVIVELEFTPNGRYRFGKTKLDIRNGKYKFELKDVLYELEYKEGEIYNKDVLIQSENRLNRVSILENPRLQITDVDTVNMKINFSVLGRLRDKYELQPEILGYDIQNEFYAGLGLTFSDLYFLNDSRTFKINVKGLLNSLDNYRMELSMDIFQPHLFKSNKISGNLNVGGDIYSIIDYRIEDINGKATVRYELPRYTYINSMLASWELSNERYTFKFPILVLDETTQSIDTIASGSFVNIFNSILGFTMIHSKVDNFQFPQRGVYQSFLIEESGLLGDLIGEIFDISHTNYVKLSFNNNMYFPVTSNPQKSVLGNKLLIGQIFEYGDNIVKLSGEDQDYNTDLIPLEYRFIAGGSTSVRAWNAKKLGTFPNREFGGNFIFEGSFEHRTRPFLDTKGYFKDLGFVTFLDYGNLWEEIKYFKISDIAVAIGTGIRYYTIVGPVRLDFAFKLYDYDPAQGTDKWLFSNSIETIFKDKFAIQFGIGHTF